LAHKGRPDRKEIPEPAASQVHKARRVRKVRKVLRDRKGHKARRVTPALRASRVLLERPVRKEIPERPEPQARRDSRVRKETPALMVRRDRRVFQVLKGCKGNPDLRDLLERAEAVLTESTNSLKMELSRFQQASPISSWRCGEGAVREVLALAAEEEAAGAIRARLFLSHPEGLTTL
jgi:hypothetical protein